MLRQKTASGVLWNFAQQLATRGIGIIVTLLLARFLTPEDFGLVAMMAIFMAIATSLMQSGFQEALLRKKNANQTDFSTAFYANLTLGAIAYILLFAAAPLIAVFYSEPRLINLVRVTGLAIVITSFQIVQIATLSRDLNFKIQLKASIPASMISGFAAVIAAYIGMGVWALVLQTILGTLLTTLLLWRLRLWRPTLEFSNQSARGMYNFGYKLFLSGLLNTIFQNLYIAVIAKLFSATIAGFYFFAEKIKELIIMQFVSAIQTVTYPALSTLQDDDVQLKEAYRKVIRVTTFLLFPAMLFMAALAEPIFRVFLPDTWLPAASYLQLMCIAGVMYPLNSINLNILKVKGRSDLFLYLGIIKKCFVVIILVISTQFGIYGILIGQIISSVISYIPNSYFSKKLIGYPEKEQLYDFLPNLALSMACAGLIYVIRDTPQLSPLGSLIVLGGLGGGLYILSAYLLKLRSYDICANILRENLVKNAT